MVKPKTYFITNTKEQQCLKLVNYFNYFQYEMVQTFKNKFVKI